MTVSRVINGAGYVREEVRARVQAAIEELDYSPNWLARSLKKKATKVIGIIVPDIGNPYAAEVARGIQTVLGTAGYGSFLSTVDPSGENEHSVLQALYDHRVDGIIVAIRRTTTGVDTLRRLADRHIPIVVIGRLFDHPNVDRVAADDHAGGFAAVQHLAELGHRRIGFIGATPTIDSPLPRYEGYLAGVREHCLEEDPELMIPPLAGVKSAFTTQHDGYEGMQRLLSLARPPTAVFARNDYTAMGALRAVRRAGISIPRDISLVGFDDVPLAAFTTPPLTTVKQPIDEQGQEAARLLLKRIEAKGAGDRVERVFPCDLVVRESSGPAPPTHSQAGG
jgi:DNA-binding LacI/PurR family transcriptional regulator